MISPPSPFELDIRSPSPFDLDIALLNEYAKVLEYVEHTHAGLVLVHDAKVAESNHLVVASQHRTDAICKSLADVCQAAKDDAQKVFDAAVEQADTEQEKAVIDAKLAHRTVTDSVALLSLSEKAALDAAFVQLGGIKRLIAAKENDVMQFTLPDNLWPSRPTCRFRVSTISGPKTLVQWVAKIPILLESSVLKLIDSNIPVEFLKYCTDIPSITFVCCDISDDDLRHFATSEVVEFINCNLVNEGLLHLTGAKRVRVEHCDNVSSDTFDKLLCMCTFATRLCS